MPDLLGVTNAVPGNDANLINRNMPSIPNDPRVQNATDLNRVSRPDNRAERQDAGETGSQAARYDSNFITFLQRMSETPGLARTMAELLRSYQGTRVSSGMEEGIAVEMSALLEMLKMDEKAFSAFFRSQMDLSRRFSGPLFNILREAFGNSGSEVLRGNILQFLKRYSDYSSSQHVQGNLLRTLTRLTRAIPASYGNQLLAMVSELEGKMGAGDRSGALKLLQGSIMPFLAGYTSRTNDMGLSRALISLLALDVARYESGSKEGVMQAFRQLGGSAMLREKLGGVSEVDLLRLLERSRFGQASGSDQFADQLAQTAQRALRGGSGAEVQDAFRNIVSAFLINESVYMPLTHLVLPLEWLGKMMFIQDLGFFDIVLTCQRENVDLQIFGPPAVADFAGTVQGEMGRILSENGLKPVGVQVQAMERPLDVSAVFPKIFEGENSINVSA